MDMSSDLPSVSAVHRETERQKTVLLYRNALPAQLLNLVNGALFAYAQEALGAAPTVVASWWLCLAALSAGRYLLIRRFLAANPDGWEAPAWRRRYIASTTAAALIWGSATALFMWHGSDAALLFTCIVLSGTAAGALAILSSVTAAFRTYAVVIMAPMSAVILLQASTPMYWALGMLVLIFLAALLIGARHLHQTLDSAIRLGIEKGNLAASLDQARLVAETSLVERRQAVDRLRVTASVFANSQEGIVITGRDGKILEVNAAFSEITGYSAEEAIGKTPRLFKSDRHDQAFYAAMWETLDQQGTWQGEIWNRRKNGDVFPEWLNITAVFDDDGQLCHYVGTMNDITQRKASEAEIKHLAFFDPLTQLPNRRLLIDRLNHAFTGSARSGRNSALLFIDLDNFKTLNDTMGHDKGDQLLVQAADRLSACVREHDTVARFGGDEFVVMLEGVADNPADAKARTRNIGEKICSALSEVYTLGDYQHHSTCSIGAALFGGAEDSVEEILKRADLAMYQAKAAGRNIVRFFDKDMQEVINARAAMEADLRQALRRRELAVYYQPQVDRDGRVTGAEALVRWNHPQQGFVSPADFIPVAEETGLIQPLGQWVLETACVQLAAWADHPRLRHARLSVNISARQFRQPDFVEQVLATLGQVGANPLRLKLEITESLFLDDVESAIAKMTALKAKGIGFSLDDFGTGYSSLSYLKRLPLDELKIDQSFVRDVLTDPNDAAIARTIVALTQSLGLSVIAEGVETEAQRDFLRRAGCFAYQGYLFGRPLPIRQFEQNLAEGRWLA